MASVKIRNRLGQWIDLVLDNVTSDSSHQALSAKQGKLLSQNKADKSTTLSGYGILDAYTKTEVDALVSAVFKYKGVKATVADVEAIQNPRVGDVWFVTADGSEYAWNGTIWERLGPVIDLSHFITQISIAGIVLDVNSTTITSAQLIQALDIYTKSEVYNKTEVDNQLSTKVPTTRKINNKTLSQDITLDKNDVGLSNVDNTSDTDKPISTAQQTALDSKLNKNQGTTNTGKFMKVGSNGELVPDDAYQKPASGIPASDLADGVIPDISGKADKVQNAVQGNFAGLDSNGNLIDSGHKHSDYAAKADTVLSTTLSRGRTANSIIGEGSFAFGNNVTASGAYSHAEGGRAQIYYGSLYFNPVASGERSHAENGGTIASGKDSHAEGEATTASGVGSHAEGYYSVASGLFSHAEGGRETMGTGLNMQIRYPTASGENSHAENGGTTASGKDSHAEGHFTEATGDHSHAEGYRTKASKMGAHAEGILTKADGLYSHAEGRGTASFGNESHVEGNYSVASGYYSHSEGNYTKATHRSQHVFGEYNIEDPSEEEASEKGTFVEIVGNGTASNARSNARTLDWEGNERLKGDIYVNCNADGSGGTKLDPIVFATDSEIQDIIDDWEVSA